MPEKRRKPSAETEPSKTNGRPRTLPEELDTRHQIRCNKADLDAWRDRARELGHRDVSSWIRKLANDDVERAR